MGGVPPQAAGHDGNGPDPVRGPGERVPVAFWFGWPGLAQLLVVSIVVAAANIAFNAAGGAYLKALVPPQDLLVANGRFESATWTATMVGPPLGGAVIAMFGPVTTVVADAFSYLLSALGIRAIGGTEPRPGRTGAPRLRAGDLLEGWRHILAHPTLRPLLLNSIVVNGLIMASEPLLAVLLLGMDQPRRGNATPAGPRRGPRGLHGCRTPLPRCPGQAP
jgi:MFS family permease